MFSENARRSFTFLDGTFIRGGECHPQNPIAHRLARSTVVIGRNGFLYFLYIK
jgi:hypothetical protein